MFAEPPRELGMRKLRLHRAFVGDCERKMRTGYEGIECFRKAAQKSEQRAGLRRHAVEGVRLRFALEELAHRRALSVAGLRQEQHDTIGAGAPDAFDDPLAIDSPALHALGFVTRQRRPPSGAKDVMMPTLDERAREAAYRDVEDILASDPGAIAFRHQRACLLGLLGRREEAHAAFIELLSFDPKNFGVLNDFGMFLFSGGLRKAAAVALEEAVRWHPDDAIGLTNLGSLYLTDGDVKRARAQFERAVRLDPSSPKAREGLSLVLRRLGDEEGARRERPVLVREKSMIAPFAYDGVPIKVMLVESVIGGNIYARQFLDDPAFDVRQVFLEFLPDGVPFPEHDVVWNAVGDAERCANLLEISPLIFARTSAPVLCRPQVVRGTRRVDIASRLAEIGGVRTPRTVTVARSDLTASDGRRRIEELGLVFPLLLRSPGFHTGEHFVRVEVPDDIGNAASLLPGKFLTAMEFVDVRSGDGKFRKYRVIAVDGQVFPLHLAVSSQWKVHYFSADMNENAAHREEDAAYLRDFESVLGAKALEALRSIVATLQLDYGGVDFSIDENGQVVVFEANATMIVPEPDDDERWAYRLPMVQRVHDAVRRMVVLSAQRAGGVRSGPRR